MNTDYYAVLGLNRSADEKEIKSAYRRLARKYHPDVNPGDAKAEARFKEVSEAYEVLGDPEKRRMYDQFGHNWEAASKFGGMPHAGQGGDFHFEGGGGGFESIFEHLFQNMGRGRRGGINMEDLQASQPRDVEKVVELSLEEVDSGTKRTLTYQTMDSVQTREGISQVPTTKRVEVTIPAGITEGKKLRVPGKGATGVRGKSGDLYVMVKWAIHPQFKVVGDTLEVDVAVPFTVAALGGEIKVPTLRGGVTMKIPAGTQSGQTFRLAGQGIAKLGGTRGNLLARIKITVPKTLSGHQRELMQALAASMETANA